MAKSSQKIERHDKETDANEHRYHLSQKQKYRFYHNFAVICITAANIIK